MSAGLGEGHRAAAGSGRVQGAEGCYYPAGSMGALCRWSQSVGRRGEGPGSEQHPVIMFVNTEQERGGGGGGGASWIDDGEYLAGGLLFLVRVVLHITHEINWN